MSNVPVTPLPPEPRAPLTEESAPPSGVRKLLDAFEERDLSRIRWSSVLGGLFLALGVDTLLGLFGLAIGLSFLDLGKRDPLARLSTGMAVWMAFSSLVALFLGGYAAAKLGGSIRRGDGALSGALTWAVALTLAVFVFSGGVPSFVEDTSSEDENPTSTISAPAHAKPLLFVQDQERDEAREAARYGKRQLAIAAWGGFSAAVVSLIAAAAGGALGAVGKRRGALERLPRTKEDDHIPIY